jgi:hypothetical protein
MVRQAHHPEPSRRANNNDQNSKPVLVIRYWNLRFICNLVLGVWDFTAIEPCPPQGGISDCSYDQVFDVE